jgi:hypothetical protein
VDHANGWILQDQNVFEDVCRRCDVLAGMNEDVDIDDIAHGGTKNVIATLA